MKTLTSKYILVLGILTLVILGSQILMQQTISGSETDARIINISGRQRMLSQKITKASLKLTNSKTEFEFSQAKDELVAARDLWSQSHIDLRYGSDELNVEEMNQSSTLNQLFKDIEPLFKSMKTASDYLVESEFEDLRSESELSQIKFYLSEITSQEADFLKLMNKITFQYDHLASAKIDSLSNTEYYLMAITFLLIILEVFFIFRPMFKDSKNKDKAIEELNELVDSKKSFESNQIAQANKTIQDLRKFARKLRTEMETKQNEYAIKTTEQMTKYLKISADYKEVLNLNKLLKEELETFKAKSLVSK